MDDYFKKNLKIILSIVIVFIILTIIFISKYYYNEYKKDLHKNQNENTIKKSEKKIEIKKDNKEENKDFYFVDIKGAVKNPGVYKLEKNLRVNDAINVSGGLLEDSDTSILNLSKKIKDEMLIIVYTKAELEEYKKSLAEIKEINKKKEEELLCPDKSNDACITNDKADSNSSDSGELNKTELISINLATKEELMTLKGIGESKAECIIEYREKNGLFKSIEDIKNVSGIGDSMYEKIKDYITV